MRHRALFWLLFAAALTALAALAACGSPEKTATRSEAEEAARKAVQSSSSHTPEAGPRVGPEPAVEPDPPRDASAAVNDLCPVMGGPTDPTRTMVFEDQKIAFCCQRCTIEWLGYSAEQKRVALAAAIANADG